MLPRRGRCFYRGSPHFTPVLQILVMKTGQPVWAAPVDSGFVVIKTGVEATTRQYLQHRCKVR